MKNGKELINDPATVRFMAWIDRHGGCVRVALAMGKRPQILYNIRNGKNRIGTETIQLILAAYPDFDAGYILTGRTDAIQHPLPVGENSPASEPNGASLAGVWEKRYWALERRHHRLYDAVLGDKLGRDLDFHNLVSPDADDHRI